jgi:hypothetical protein
VNDVDFLVDKTTDQNGKNKYSEALTDLGSDSPPLQAAAYSAIRELISNNDTCLPELETLLDLLIVGIKSDEGYVQYHALKALTALAGENRSKISKLILKNHQDITQSQSELMQKAMNIMP